MDGKSILLYSSSKNWSPKSFQRFENENDFDKPQIFSRTKERLLLDIKTSITEEIRFSSSMFFPGYIYHLFRMNAKSNRMKRLSSLLVLLWGL